MIQSQYILDIFDLLFDDHKASQLLRKQVEYLSVGDTEHTGVGLIINFITDEGIEDFRVPKDLLISGTDSKETLEMVNGLEIINESQNILADATVHLKEGLIKTLEIWNKGGDKYPLTDPQHYSLHQSWRVENEKRHLER